MKKEESYRGLTVTIRLDDVSDLSRAVSDLKAAFKTDGVAELAEERQFRDISEQIRNHLS